MAKPRIFVSSTYYDLRHIRDRLEAFIEALGYEPVLFESGDIPFRHDSPLDESCYAEIKLCHVLILIIGGRYGSPASDEARRDEIDKRYEFYNSITRKEYLAARERDIPLFIFVEKNVLAEYDTYKHNKRRSDIEYAHVESVNVFRLLDEILSRERNNFVRGFDRFDDISAWLRDQWAGLFADLISKRGTETGIKDLAVRVAELGQITSALKEYSEMILKNLQPDRSKKIIDEQDRKLEKGRVSAFIREPMIDYIRFHAKGRPDEGAVSPERVFQAFRDSENLEAFLSAVGFSDEYVKKFIEANSPIAQREYEIIGERYFDRPAVKRVSESPIGSQGSPRKAVTSNAHRGGRKKSTPQ